MSNKVQPGDWKGHQNAMRHIRRCGGAIQPSLMRKRRQPPAPQNGKSPAPHDSENSVLIEVGNLISPRTDDAVGKLAKLASNTLLAVS